MKYAPIRVGPTTAERFRDNVTRGDPDACWEWQGRRDRYGYGKAQSADGPVIASRLAWLLATGEQPNAMVCHSCDNPSCVNPAHLFLGDQTANMADMLAKNGHYLSRRTHCSNGHEYTPENTYWWRRKRACRACGREKTRRYTIKSRVASAETAS